MKEEPSLPLKPENLAPLSQKSVLNVRDAPINEFEKRTLSEVDRGDLLGRAKTLCSDVEDALKLDDNKTLEWEVMLVAPQDPKKLKDKLQKNIMARTSWYFEEGEEAPKRKMTPEQEGELKAEMDKNKDQLQALAHVEVIVRDRISGNALAYFDNINIFGDKVDLKNDGEKTMQETVDFLVQVLSQNK